jgi:aquaporin Z
VGISQKLTLTQPQRSRTPQQATHTLKKSIPYILVIFAGALSSAVCLIILSPLGLEQVNPLEIDRTKVILAEFLFTFVLMWVILNVAIAKGTCG